MDKTIIELTPQEAELFIKFRQFQSLFEVLLKGRVFEIKNGKAVIHFNKHGSLILIESDLITYRNMRKI